MKLFIATTLLLFSGIAHADIATDAQKLDDAGLFSRIHAVNQGEVQIGELAAQKTQVPHIAAYAKKLVKDHTDADQILLAVAQAEKIQVGHVVPVSQEEAVRIQEHHASAKKAAMTLGRDFDRRYLAVMIKGHQDVLLYLLYAQPKNLRVRALVQTLTATVKEHLSIAQQLAASL